MENLLLADYFVITSTNRPIFCYIKNLPKLNDPFDRQIFTEKLKSHNISLEEYLILNRMYTLPKGNRLHDIAQEILTMPSYVAVCGEQFDNQSSSENTSTVSNSQHNISYSNITTQRQQYVHAHRSPLLTNIQTLRSSSTSINRNKRSISPLLIDTHTSSTNCDNTNGRLKRNIKRNIYSISSSSSQDIIEPVIHVTDNEGFVFFLSLSLYIFFLDTTITTNGIQQNKARTNALLSSTFKKRIFFKSAGELK
jgi:hypothetical protein